MKKRFILIIFFLSLIVYLTFFPHQLKKELIFIPSWAVSIDSGEIIESTDPVPFMFDSRLGYFSGNGRVLFSEDVAFNAAVSKDLFINYSSVSKSLVLQDSTGGIIGTIETEGLPFFIKERLFVISPDRMSVMEYDYEGRLKLTISPGSLITSIDAGSEVVVAGLLNGEVVVYRDSPEPVFRYYSTDSRYSISYACAVNDDGSRIAAVTGLYPQQLICFELRNEEYIPVFRKEATEVFRRNLLLDYSDDGKLLYMENSEGLEVYSTATFLKEDIVMAGEIRKALFTGVKNMSFIVSSEEDSSLLRVYRSDLGGVADFNFPSGDIYFYPAGNCFYVGADGRIVRYDIIEG